MKHTEPERDFKDPVCGMRVSRLTAVAEAEHGHKHYYFCATECRDAFLANPSKYLPRHRQHGVRPRSDESQVDEVANHDVGADQPPNPVRSD